MDDGCHHGWSGVHLAPTHNALIGIDANQAGVLRAITGCRYVGQTQDEGVDGSDFQKLDEFCEDSFFVILRPKTLLPA